MRTTMQDIDSFMDRWLAIDENSIIRIFLLYFLLYRASNKPGKIGNDSLWMLVFHPAHASIE